MKSLPRKFLSSLLAVLLLVPTLSACQKSPNPPSDTGSSPDTSHLSPDEQTGGTDLIVTESPSPDETTSTPTEDSFLSLADHGTAYRIITPSSDRIAVWEQEAASHIRAWFQEVEANPEQVEDRTAEPTDTEIVIGYTNRNPELPADFFDLGPGGYHIRVVGKKLFIGANTEAGMNAACEKLRLVLVKGDSTLRIASGYVCRAVDPGPEADPVLSGAYAESIAHARTMANGVQTHYSDNRHFFTVGNRTMSLTLPLTPETKTGAVLTNSSGIPYLQKIMTPYIQTADGAVHTTDDSSEMARANIFRYGAYYYENHLLGQNFGPAFRITEENLAASFNLMKHLSIGNSIHDVKDVRVSKDGILSYTVTSTADPYLSLSASLHLPTDRHDTLAITMKTTDTSSASFYLAAGSHAHVDGSQVVSFSLIPDNTYHTYYIPLDTVPDYTGHLRQLRLDCGSKIGETICISEIRVLKRDIPANLPQFVTDRTLHTYSDKVHEQFRFVATKEADNMQAYGMTAQISADRVRSLLILDKNGEHSSLKGVDMDSVTGVAFEVDRAGIVGFILTTASEDDRLTVSLRDGVYIIDQCRQAPDSTYAEGDIYSLVHRIYTGEEHHFDHFRKIWQEERHPLTGLIITRSNCTSEVLGYDPVKGAYVFSIEGSDFNKAYYKEPDRHFRMDVQILGGSDDRTIYVSSHTASGCLESAALLDNRHRLLPMTVQVCKNFNGEHEEPVFDKGDTSYGETYFPMVVKKQENLLFSIVNLYQNWGKFPLKQISSIQFVAPYYHLSTGVTETNCIAPYYVSGKDRWTLPDFRAMSAPLWPGQPQHTSAGRLYFLEYTDSDGHFNASENITDHIDSHGPVYADIAMSYLSDDGRIRADYRHMEMPQTDENRTYYEIRLTVLDELSIRNFQEDFSIFAMDGRFFSYDTLAYLNEENKASVERTASPDSSVITRRLGTDAPYFALAHTTASDNYVNMAMIIKDFHAVIGGRDYNDGLILREQPVGSLNRLNLTLNIGEVTLKPGDEISLHAILLPWGSQKTPEGDFSSVLKVRQDTCLHPITAEIHTGTLLPDAYMPKIRVENGTAEFTLTGGDTNMAVRVYGLSDYARPVIEEKINGQWVPYDTASAENGYDGYMVYCDDDGTYSCSFIVAMNDGAARTFRVKN